LWQVPARHSKRRAGALAAGSNRLAVNFAKLLDLLR
jgi:hypothetical protein